jgi:hypothetical protein
MEVGLTIDLPTLPAFLWGLDMLDLPRNRLDRTCALWGFAVY